MVKRDVQGEMCQMTDAFHISIRPCGSQIRRRRPTYSWPLSDLVTDLSKAVLEKGSWLWLLGIKGLHIVSDFCSPEGTGRRCGISDEEYKAGSSWLLIRGDRAETHSHSHA